MQMFRASPGGLNVIVYNNEEGHLFGSIAHGKNTISILLSPKGQEPCTFTTRYHLGDRKPGGYASEESGISSETAKAIAEACIAPLVARIDALEAAALVQDDTIAALTARLDALEPVVADNAACVAEVRAERTVTPAPTE